MADDIETTDPQRRVFLGGVAAGCVAAALGSGLNTARATSGAAEGDVLVHFQGDHAGEVVDPAALEPLTAVLAQPRAASGEVREGPENIITLVRLPEGELDPAHAGAAAGDIVAVSAVCTHQGCLVSSVGSLGTAEGHLACSCHGSVFNPRLGGERVAGPAPRGLPALPIRVAEGVIQVAGPFTGRIGPA